MPARVITEQSAGRGHRSRAIWIHAFERCTLRRMAVQRQVSPIPPGRYWMIVNGPGNMADFANWLRDMAGGVKVETTSQHQAGADSFDFVIFNVPAGRFPFLNALQFGYPNTAGPEVHSVQDVISEPIVPGGLQNIEDFAARAANDAKWGAFLLAALVLTILTIKR